MRRSDSKACVECVRERAKRQYEEKKADPEEWKAEIKRTNGYRQYATNGIKDDEQHR